MTSIPIISASVFSKSSVNLCCDFRFSVPFLNRAIIITLELYSIRGLASCSINMNRMHYITGTCLKKTIDDLVCFHNLQRFKEATVQCVNEVMLIILLSASHSRNFFVNIGSGLCKFQFVIY